MFEMRNVKGFCVSLCLTAAFGLGPVSADHGGCPIDICRVSNISLSEPKQRAIILWNGQTETLFLSTDFKHPSPVGVYELIPFPSKPDLQMGSLEPFHSVVRWAKTKGSDFSSIAQFSPLAGMSGLQTGTFQTKEGLFDFVYPPGSLNCAVPPMPPIFETYSHYFNQGYNWVAFDQIQVSETLQTFPPVEYTFKTPKLYYPLETSVHNTGYTSVDLILVTLKPLRNFSQTDYPVQRSEVLGMTATELEEISPKWAAMMGGSDVFVQQVRIEGDISQMQRDFFAQQ